MRTIRTQLKGKRIASNTIELHHLSKSIGIPEEFLKLNFPTHGHNNLDALNKFYCTNPDVTQIDVEDICNIIKEVANARGINVTLSEEINQKANKEDVVSLLKQFKDAIGDNDTLQDALKHMYQDIIICIKNHAGNISHKELDQMYEDYSLAKGQFGTLSERLKVNNSGSPTSGDKPNEVWCAEIISNGNTTIKVPNNYSPNSNSLLVYEDMLLLTSGENNDYVEVDNEHIKLNYIPEVGTTFKLMGVSGGLLFDWCIRVKSDKSGIVNTLFNYSDLQELTVYEDGLLLNPKNDYTMIDNSHIQFSKPIANCNITIYKRR